MTGLEIERMLAKIVARWKSTVVGAPSEEQLRTLSGELYDALHLETQLGGWRVSGMALRERAEQLDVYEFIGHYFEP